MRNCKFIHIFTVTGCTKTRSRQHKHSHTSTAFAFVFARKWNMQKYYIISLHNEISINCFAAAQLIPFIRWLTTTGAHHSFIQPSLYAARRTDKHHRRWFGQRFSMLDRKQISNAYLTRSYATTSRARSLTDYKRMLGPASIIATDVFPHQELLFKWK